MIQKAGFPAAQLSAWGFHFSQLGIPQLGLATMTEYRDLVQRITSVIDIPLIVDIDHGFGGPLEVHRTVRELERAGAAAVQMHDQVRGMGWMVRDDDVLAELIEDEQMVAKIRAAKDAQSDPAFMVIGRTESSRQSADEAIRRCNVWIDGGADLAMPMVSPWLYFHRDSPVDRDELHGVVSRFVRDIRAPVVIHSPFGVDFGTREMDELGVAIYVIPQVCLGFSAAATWGALQALQCDELKEYAAYLPHLSIKEFGERVDQSVYTKLAQRYGV